MALASQQEDMDIQIKGGRCKVIYGATRRVIHTTEEALGLHLLKINTTRQTTTQVQWADYLGTKGVAVAQSGDKQFTLLTFPAHKRSINFRRGDTTKDYLVTLPDLLFATHFAVNKFVKASIWIVKAGQLGKLSVASSDLLLAPYSYGNVYNHGGICWGTTPLRDIKTPQDVYEAFFSSSFNGDLFAFNSTGLLNFLNGLKGEGKEFPVPAAGAAYTKNVATVASEIVRA